MNLVSGNHPSNVRLQLEIDSTKHQTRTIRIVDRQIHKIWYVPTYVLSKVGHAAQILPVSDFYVREIKGCLYILLMEAKYFSGSNTDSTKRNTRGGD
jgi:hypothetical protein